MSRTSTKAGVTLLFLMHGSARGSGMSRRRFAAVLACTLIAPAALAQELDEVIVTATKRDEALHDVPVSLVAITGDTLRDDAIANLHDLALQVPHLSVANGLTTDNVHIRGIGSGNERSFEQSVGLFVDNVYMPRSRQYRYPFLDVERIEVVRGPQSVLFGLNATAGAVAIHTARSYPGDALGAELLAGYESTHGGTAVTGVVGGSLGEIAGLRLAGSLRGGGDGDWTNLETGGNENAAEERLVRASLVLEPAGAVTLDAKIEVADFASDGGVGELFTEAGAYSDGSDVLDWVRGQDASLLPLFPVPKAMGFDGKLVTFSAAVEAEVAAGGTLVGMLGYTDYDWSLYLDLDSGALRIADAGFEEAYRQASAELRYVSPALLSEDRPIRYTLGAWFAGSELGQSGPNLLDGNVFLAGAGFPLPGYDAGQLWARGTFDQDEDMLSAYGMIDWNVTGAVQVRAGVRYVESAKTHRRGTECLIRRTDGTFDEPDGANNPNDALLIGTGFCPTPIDPPQQSRTSDHWLPEVSVQWFPTAPHMLYAKAGKSAKSGGFVAARVVVPGNFEYGDETGTGYELGYKGAFAGGRGSVSVAFFRADYDDLQVNSFDPDTAAAIVGNAAGARTQGVELEARFAASDAVTVGALVGVLDAKYIRFERGPCHPGETRNADGFTCDKSGMRPPNAADATATAYVDVEVPLATGVSLVAGLAVDVSTAYLTNATLDPLAEQDAFTRLIARVGLAGADGDWSVLLVGRNLSEEVVNNYTEAFLGVYRGYLQPPRTIWLQGMLRLGDRSP
ncbi:MAG TPA: TonB-dependent receptor [Woeseiaceae bacterium]|nr:TonB-dependent receptor [Woeseiaceae bacterium]